MSHLASCLWWTPAIENPQLTSIFLEAFHVFPLSYRSSCCPGPAHLVPVTGPGAHTLSAKILLQNFLFTLKIGRDGSPFSLEICEDMILIMTISLVPEREKLADRENEAREPGRRGEG